MFIRQKFRTKNGKRHAYWALVESYRSERGPRQRVVSWLGKLDEQAGLGTEPRRVVDELSEIRSMDVVLPTQEGIELRQHCIFRPSDHQGILLERLGLELPKRLRQMEM